jgi:hypothetical protein
MNKIQQPPVEVAALEVAAAATAATAATIIRVEVAVLQITLDLKNMKYNSSLHK